jgi:hypothetical protein
VPRLGQFSARRYGFAIVLVNGGSPGLPCPNNLTPARRDVHTSIQRHKRISLHSRHRIPNSGPFGESAVCAALAHRSD